MNEEELNALIQQVYEESDGRADVLFLPWGDPLLQAIEGGEFDKMEDDPQAWVDEQLQPRG